MISLSLDYENFSNKPKPNDAKYISNRIAYRATNISEKQFFSALESGKTWSAVFKDNKRRADTWASQQLFAADIDKGGMSPEEALGICETNCIDPLVIHHSFSSTAKKPKLRVIVKLTEPVLDPVKALGLQVKLTHMFGGDPCACDIARIYYGSKPGSITFKSSSSEMSIEDMGPLPDLGSYVNKNSIDPDLIKYADSHEQSEVLRKLWRESQGRYNLIIKVLGEQEERVKLVKEGSRYMSVFKASVRLSQFRELYANCILDTITTWVNECTAYIDWEHINNLLKIVNQGITFGRKHLYD